MSGVILPLRGAPSQRGGTVHVMADPNGGFRVSHESASGNSWGELFGPYSTGQAALAAAYALNRDAYGGVCDITICDAARADRTGVTAGPRSGREDF